MKGRKFKLADKVWLVVMALVCMSAFISCEKDKIEDMEIIKVSSEGLKLKKVSGGMEAPIPASGMSFTVIPQKKFRKMGYVSMVNLNGKSVEGSGDENRNGNSWEPWKGEWGSIDYDMNTTPHRINIHIAPNKTGEKLTYIIKTT